MKDLIPNLLEELELLISASSGKAAQKSCDPLATLVTKTPAFNLLPKLEGFHYICF